MTTMHMPIAYHMLAASLMLCSSYPYSSTIHPSHILTNLTISMTTPTHHTYSTSHSVVSFLWCIHVLSPPKIIMNIPTGQVWGQVTADHCASHDEPNAATTSVLRVQYSRVVSIPGAYSCPGCDSHHTRPVCICLQPIHVWAKGQLSISMRFMGDMRMPC